MAEAAEAGVRVVDDPAERRYEAYLDGALAGWVTYRLVAGRVVFVHTEVDPTFAGRGVGTRLAAGALDDVRARGLKARAVCPFIAAYLERHREYADLIVDDPREPRTD